MGGVFVGFLVIYFPLRFGKLFVESQKSLDLDVFIEWFAVL